MVALLSVAGKVHEYWNGFPFTGVPVTVAFSCAVGLPQLLTSAAVTLNGGGITVTLTESELTQPAMLVVTTYVVVVAGVAVGDGIRLLSSEAAGCHT